VVAPVARPVLSAAGAYLVGSDGHLFKTEWENCADSFVLAGLDIFERLSKAFEHLRDIVEAEIPKGRE
jgi:hypothetical protein